MFKDVDIENKNVLQFLVNYLLKKFDDPEGKTGYIQRRTNIEQNNIATTNPQPNVEAEKIGTDPTPTQIAKPITEEKVVNDRLNKQQDDVLSLISGNATESVKEASKASSSKKQSKKTPNSSPTSTPAPVAAVSPSVMINTPVIDSKVVKEETEVPSTEAKESKDRSESLSSSASSSSPFIWFSGVAQIIGKVGNNVVYAASGVNSQDLTAAKVQHAKNFVERISVKELQKVRAEEQLRFAVKELQQEVDAEFQALVETHRTFGGAPGDYEALLTLFKNALSVLVKDQGFMKMSTEILQYEMDLNAPNKMLDAQRAGKEFTSKVFRILVLLEVNAISEQTLSIPMQSDMVMELKRAINKQFKNNMRNEDDLHEDLLVNVRSVLFEIDRIIKAPPAGMVASVASTLRPILGNTDTAHELLTNIREIISRYLPANRPDAKSNSATPKLSVVKG